MVITTFIPQTPIEQVSSFQVASLLFCFFIALSVYMMLPKKMALQKRLYVSGLLFVGIWGLFLILVLTLSNLLAQ